MQQAFIHNINGTIEHNQLLQETLQHARHNKKTCHVTFFDLKDAFGSISHELIQTCLERYNVPLQVQQYVKLLYSNINGTVCGPNWKSDPFIFKRGVFQGDPLSSTIFLIVFNPLIEYLKTEIEQGYALSKEVKVISTPFADDFNVITGNRRTHQRILHNISNFAKSMNLILEPKKCKSISIWSGKSTEIPFNVNEMKVPSIKEDPEKFLGSHITFSGKPSEISKYVMDGIKIVS